MAMGLAKRKPRPKRDAPKRHESAWYTPTVKDVYAQVLAAKTMLDRIPDAELAIVKREMGILEDMMWQFAGEN